MEVNVKNKPKSTIELEVKIPVEKVKAAYNDVLNQVVSNTELPGFRKGNAPKDKVLEKTDVSQLYGEVVNVLLQTYYPQALKEKHISPVSNPKVEIKEFDMEKDFEFVATLATRPEVKIGNYKKAIKELHEKQVKELKKTNEEKLKKGESIETDHIHIGGNDLVDAVLSSAEVEIADMLVDDEVDRMMARLVDQAQSIGLSLETYLKSQNKTPEQLRNEYAEVAIKSLKAEFVLSDLVVKEGINVPNEDIEEAVRASGIEDAEEKLKNPAEKWYIQSVLEKNRLLIKLAEEAEGEHKHE